MMRMRLARDEVKECDNVLRNFVFEVLKFLDIERAN